MFSEFDASHSDDDARQGTPLGAAHLCFASGMENIFVQSMLQTLRHSETTLERKASLYLKPFEVQEGYLAGYMAVKNLYWSMHARKPGLTTEFFLSYVRSFFWDDPVYVNLLISSDMNGAHVVEALDARFSTRLVSLFSDPELPRRAEAFMERWAGPGPYIFTHEIGVEQEDVQLAHQRMERLLRHSLALLTHNPQKLEKTVGISSDEVRELFMAVARHRGYVVLAEAPVRVQKAESRIIFEGDGELGIQVNSAEQALPADGRYEYSVVLPTFANYMASVFKGDDGRVHVTGSIGPPQVNIDYGLLMEFVQSRSSTLARTQQLRAQFERTGYPELRGKVLDDLLAEIKDRARDIYVIAATARIREAERREGARQAIRANGVRSIVRRDPIGLRVIAGISLLNGAEKSLHRHSKSALIKLVRLWYLSDTEETILHGALSRIVESDVDHVVVAELGEELFVLV